MADQGLTGLGKPEYAFQTGQMPALDPGAGEIRGISVFITREEPYNRGPIENVDRDQIPDALITYPESGRAGLVGGRGQSGRGADEKRARAMSLEGYAPAWTQPNQSSCNGPSSSTSSGHCSTSTWSPRRSGVSSTTSSTTSIWSFAQSARSAHSGEPAATIARSSVVAGPSVAEATELDAREPVRAMGLYVELADQRWLLGVSI